MSQIFLSATIATKKGEIAAPEILEAHIKASFKLAVDSGEDLKDAAEVVVKTFKPVFKIDDFGTEHEEL